MFELICYCMKDEEFKNANKEERISMIRAVYDRYVEKPKANTDNWNRSLKDVRKLVELDYEVTRCLYTYTTWHGEANVKRFQLLNIDEIHHNEEFVSTLRNVLFAWGQKDPLEEWGIGWDIKAVKGDRDDAIRKSVKKFYTEYPEYGEMPKVKSGMEGIRYLSLQENPMTETKYSPNMTISGIKNIIIY